MKTVNVLFATTMRPVTEEQAILFNQELRRSFNENNCVVALVGGIIWTEGPGCANLSFKLKGEEDDIEEAGRSLCMGLMPSKWCETNDDPPDEDVYNLNPIK
jgi:hypothetical protein